MTANKDAWFAARLIPQACDYRRDRIKTPNLLSGFSHLPLLPLVPTQPGLRPVSCRSAFCLKYRRDYYRLGGGCWRASGSASARAQLGEHNRSHRGRKHERVFLDHHLALLLATRLQLFPAILNRSIKTAAFKIAYL